MNYIIAGVAMAASNFLYQAVHHLDFMTAFERSWFQLCALMTAWLIGLYTSVDVSTVQVTERNDG